MSTPRVSVIMSVYNNDSYIQKSVESISLQTFLDWEFIIVDDGSQDDTSHLLELCASQDPRIKIIRNSENLGVVKSLNIGLELAKGEYIARQDGDDISLPDRLALQVRLLDSNSEIGAVGICAQMVDPMGFPLRIGFSLTTNFDIQKNLLDYNCICGPTIMVRRKCLEQIGNSYSEGLDASEDYDLCLRLAEITQLVNLDHPVYLYRQHPDSASNKKKYQQTVNKAIALDKAIQRRYGSSPPPENVSYLARDYLRASVLGYASNDISGAQQYLILAQQYDPRILETGAYVKNFVISCIPEESTAAALEFTYGIFDNLFPPTRNLSRLKSRLVSKIHMKEVFAHMDQQPVGGFENHLWAGIKEDPSWLLNRGVLSVILNHFRHSAK